MKWNGRNYKPLLPQKIRFQEEKFDVEEYMKSLQEKHDRVPVWRSIPNPIAVNVPVGEGPVPPPAFDADAAAFLNQVLVSGGTLDATISAATNTLFTTLKSCGVYSKLGAMYPFVGATANSHAINAVNLSSYTISWSGGLTHNVSGTTGNGTNGYGNTGFKQNSLPLNSVHYSVYQNSQNTNTRADETQLGMIEGGGAQFLLQTRAPVGGGVFNNRMRLGSNASMSTNNNGVSAACFIATRSGTTTSTIFKNNTPILTNTSTYTNGTVARDIFLWAMNLTGTIYGDSYSNNRLAFTTIGSGLTQDEVGCLNDAIITFNTELGRVF